ncbi:MAG: PfkB family carbohydrate kinase [Cyanobacteria bacterium P01_F01_bin.150]
MTTISKKGLFVGLTTHDLIYQVEAPPKANQKLVASDYIMAAGGPATNAAIAFQHLSQISTNQPIPSPPYSTAFATILSVIGNHPIGHLVKADIEQGGVAIADLNPAHSAPVPTSSIMVTAATGERAVVSLNAVKSVALPHQIPEWIDSLWDQIGVVLIDGHQMKVGEAIAHIAQQKDIPVVVDAGSWKPGFEKVLVHATHIVCSENFYPPNCQSCNEIHDFLQNLGVPHIAITHGSDPIQYWHKQVNRVSNTPQLIPVPSISPVDTLGAGDIFHGAFCYYLLDAAAKDFDGPAHSRERSHLNIPAVLSKAAQIASESCASFGPRAWMRQENFSKAR